MSRSFSPTPPASIRRRPSLVPPPSIFSCKATGSFVAKPRQDALPDRAPTDRRGVHLPYSLVLRPYDPRRRVALRSAVGPHLHRSITSRVHRHAHYITLPRQLAGGESPASRLETGSTGKPSDRRARLSQRGSQTPAITATIVSTPPIVLKTTTAGRCLGASWPDVTPCQIEC